MGQSTNAVLAYGYDLGGGEGEWKIRETDEYGSIDASNASTLAWYDEDSDDDFRTQAELPADAVPVSRPVPEWTVVDEPEVSG